jgi:hypothetical protein
MNDAAKEAGKTAEESTTASTHEPEYALKRPMRHTARPGLLPGPERGLQCPPRGRLEIS